jgi:hypothetical protein
MLDFDRAMASEIDSLIGWVRPYELLRNAVVVLGKSLRAPLKQAIILSGPDLPLEVRLSEPTEEGAECTQRIFVETDENAPGDSVRVRLFDPQPGSSLDGQARTIAWDGDPVQARQVITAIRELAGLDAA